jgi:hypothetical protein
MHHSPAKICTDIIEKLHDPSSMFLGVKELAGKASDPTVADVFVNQGGLTTLLELIEKDRIGDKEQALQYAFQSLLDIMYSSSSATWERIEGPVLSK